MGEVYRAHDTRLRRDVAIKTVAFGARDDPAIRERFAREARAVAALSHPNILAIYDVGEYDRIPYVAVELLEGDTLRPHLGTSPLPLSTALDYAVQIGRGLAAAHDRGIVHRDLKPENIFVTRDGQVKLLDFGLATEPAGETGDEATRAARTEAGMVLGTAGYMSPEQARGEHTDTHSDIFSFGCVLYEMVAGRRAFTGDSRIETLHAVLKEHPPDLTNLRSDVSPPLNRVVRRCLEKAPESRFQTARDLVFALENLAAGSGPTTAASRPARRAAPAERRWPSSPLLRCWRRERLWWWTVLREPAPQEAARRPGGRGPAGCWPCCRSRTSRAAARDICAGHDARGHQPAVEAQCAARHRPDRGGAVQGSAQPTVRDRQGARHRQRRHRHRPRGRRSRARQRRADRRAVGTA